MQELFLTLTEDEDDNTKMSQEKTSLRHWIIYRRGTRHPFEALCLMGDQSRHGGRRITALQASRIGK